MSVDPVLNRVFEGFLRSSKGAERMPWGWLVSDERFPHLYDVNCAFVTDGDPSLGEIESVLIPALRRTNVRHEHIQMLDAFPRLIAEIEERGDEVGWDTWMIHESPLPSIDTSAVEEITDLDEAFWAAVRASLAVFEVKEGAELDEFVAFEHLLAAGGKRWFAIMREGRYASLAALLTHGDVCHVDNVVTFEEFRRQGLASAVVARAVQEASGAKVTLFTDSGKGAASLYEHLGFVDHGSIPSLLRRLG